MTLYVNVKTHLKDAIIDYISVKLKSGETVSLNWDESEISRTNDGLEMECKRVCFGTNYAHGWIGKLKGMQIDCIGAYTESESREPITITAMEFVDDDIVLTIPDDVLPYTADLKDIDWTM